MNMSTGFRLFPLAAFLGKPVPRGMRGVPRSTEFFCRKKEPDETDKSAAVRGGTAAATTAGTEKKKPHVYRKKKPHVYRKKKPHV